VKWLVGLLLVGCASPPEEDDLWYCEEQGQFLVCVPERSIDVLTGTRIADSVHPSASGTRAPWRDGRTRGT